MKFIYWLFLAALVLNGSNASAASANREATINRINRAYAKSTGFSSAPPLVDQVIESAKSKNGGSKEEIWQNLKPEFVSALDGVQRENERVFCGHLSTILAGLSDEEVERLALILEDPVLVKFQLAVSTPTFQKQIMQSSSGLILLYKGAINKVLTSHGLHELR